MSDDNRDIKTRIAQRFASWFHRKYAKGKISADPIYPAVADKLALTTGPVLDLGCGIGLLGQFLRQNGNATDVRGVDFDSRKVDAARYAAKGIEGLSFEVGDVRERLDFRGSVAMLDLLHYFTDDEQRRIISNAADYARPGDVVIVRECIRDESWRYRLTWLAETFATSIGWLRGERLNFPTCGSIVDEFERRHFEVEVVPLWGGTPFNNYLLTFRCL